MIKNFLKIIYIIFAIKILVVVSFPKVCNNEDLFKFGITALCESQSKLSISCLKNARKAYVQCRDGYYNEKNISQQIINCMDDGQWSESPIKCIPQCIPFSNEFKLLEKNEITFPTSYAEIIRKNPIENEMNTFPGLIVHPKKIITKSEFFKETEHDNEFLILLPNIQTTGKEYEIMDSYDNNLKRIEYNNQEFIEFNLINYIEYDENIRQSCFFYEIEKNLTLLWIDYNNFIPVFKKECFVPDLDDRGSEILCYNQKSIPHIEKVSNDGKFAFGGAATGLVQDECSETAEEVLIRCRLGHQNLKSKDKYSISHCLDKEWEFQPTGDSSCKRICGDIDPTYDPLVKPLLYKGYETNIITAPWHVAVFANNTKESDSFEQICGGSIIHSNIVISAAHCFYNEASGELYHPSSYLIAAGKRFRSYNVYEETEHYNGVEKIHIPSTFQSQPIRDDIAVLILNHNFEYTTHIKPICIDWVSYKEFLIADSARGRTVGWGSTSREGGPSENLLTVNLRTIINSECKKLVDPNYRPEISNDKFCATNNDNATACRGDSGGGFVIKRGRQNKGYYVLAGIISVGLDVKKHCSSGFLSLFTNIQFHQDFIKAIVDESRGFGLFERKNIGRYFKSFQLSYEIE